MIESREASLRYHDGEKIFSACDSISLRVESGEFLGILGPSGSGKSSLLYLLSSLKTPTDGSIWLGDRNLATMTDEGRGNLRLQEFGFIFQYPYLLGYLSALENILVARTDKPRMDEARALLDALGLGHKAHRLPHELSGGERQRVCVARALLGSPKVIFADEPTASLDHQNGMQVVQLLNQHRGAGALVMVTHDESMLADADRIIQIVDGRIVG